MLSPRVNKVVRDLLANKVRSILVILSIAVGVFAFAGVFTANELLIKEMDIQYRSITPASVTLGISNFDDALVKWVRSQPDIKDASPNTSAIVKLKKDNKTSIMTLRAYPNYQDIAVNKIDLLGPAKTLNVGEAFLEQSSLGPAKLQIGDYFEVETPGGTTYALKVVGVVHDLNAIPANLFPQYTAYISPLSLRKMDIPSDYTQLQIALDERITTKEEAQEIAEDLKKRIEGRGYTVNSLQTQKPNEHWAKEVTAAFTLILTVVGSFSLVLSAFLVINTMSALIAREKKQIGIMKAVGGSSKQIMGVYLTSIALFGILAFFVAVPIGLLLAYLYLSFIATFLNLSITNFYLPFSVLILEIAAALLIPLVASFLPILIGTRISVIKALTPMSDTKGSKGLLNRIIVSWKFLPRPFLLAFRNTFNKFGRLLLTLITLIIAGVLFISVSSVRSSLTADMEASLKVQNYDISLYLSDWYGIDNITRQAKKTPELEDVDVQISTGGRKVENGELTNTRWNVVGVRPESDFLLPQMVSGRWLTSSDKNALVITTTVLKDLPDLKVGDDVILRINEVDKKFEVVGMMILAGEQQVSVYTTYDSLATVLGKSGLTQTLLVRMDEGTSITQQQMVEDLEETLKERGFQAAASVTMDTIRQASEGQFNFLVGFLLAMSVMVAAVGGLGLMGTMSLNVLERTREIGILRGIGASDGVIRTMVLTEGATIGFVSWLIAIPLSLPASYLFGYAIGMAFVQKPLVFDYSLSGLFIWLIIITVIALFASLLPARRASSMSVRDALAYE